MVDIRSSLSVVPPTAASNGTHTSALTAAICITCTLMRIQFHYLRSYRLATIIPLKLSTRVVASLGQVRSNSARGFHVRYPFLFLCDMCRLSLVLEVLAVL